MEKVVESECFLRQQIIVIEATEKSRSPTRKKRARSVEDPLGQISFGHD